MARGERYYVYNDLTIHYDAASALSGANPGSTLRDNWNSAEGYGTPYIDNAVNYAAYYPAVAIWWVPAAGGTGYSIGWVDDRKNGFPLTVYDDTHTPRRAKGVWVYDDTGAPRKAKGVWVYDANGTPRQAK